MATVIQAERPRTKLVDPSSRIVLYDIPWEFYEKLREEERNWNVRMSYESGVLELMSPSQIHEEIDNRFELFMVSIAQGLRFEFLALVHTTWKNEVAEKAKEADACYYITNFDRIRGKTIDLKVDPTTRSRGRGRNLSRCHQFLEDLRGPRRPRGLAV